MDVPLTNDRTPEDHEERQAADGDSTEVKDFGIYLTPSQARSIIENARTETVAERETEDVEYQPTWTNPFVYLLFKDGGNLYEGALIEDGILVDAHRLAFAAFNHPPSAGSELIYPGGNINNCRPQHANELALSNELSWQAGIVEAAVLHLSFLELQISTVGSEVQRVFVKRDILDRYGFGDASSLVERPIFLTTPVDKGWVQLIPAARRVDYSQGSPVSGWLHPPKKVRGSRKCPCGSGRNYSTCHGEHTVS